MTHTRSMRLLALPFIATLACSTLPDYAAPKGYVADPDSLDMSDVIPYRTLTRADFKGAEAPMQFAGNADRIGAATCGHILTTPDTRVRVELDPSGRTPVYRATPEHLRFQAQMDRNCSWWNPKDLGLPQEYILEHEQIHFAIFELEARRLNASLPEIEAKVNATAATAEDATELAQQRLRDQLERRLRGILERSRDFDEDASMGHNPVAQKRWWDRVHAELEATRD